MPVFIGAKNQTLFWGAGNADGTSNVRMYLGEKLVYVPFRPPEGDLLLAGKGVYLKGGADVYLDYKNTPLVLQDSLSGKDIGTGPFDISFDFTPRSTNGTRQLFEVPGLVCFGYDLGKGYGLLVYLHGVGCFAVGTQSTGGPVVQTGTNKVRLYHANSDADVCLEVNGVKFTLLRSWQKWVYDKITAYNSVGEITSYNNNSGSQTDGSLGNTQYPGFGVFYFRSKQEMKDANLSPTPWSYYWQVLESSSYQNTWVRWRLPKKCRIKEFELYFIDGGWGSSATFALFSDNKEENQIGSSLNTVNSIKTNISVPSYEAVRGFEKQVLENPVQVEELFLTVKGNTNANFLAYGIWLIAELEEFVGAAFACEKLHFYSSKEISGLILKDSFGG
nr:MAG TPA: hypothetical protein [Caudoviricetes sp.]